MTTANLFIELTDRHGLRELRNLALYALVARNPEGGCKLYPGSLNERYDGVATHVREDFDAFMGLPGFVPVESEAHELKGTMLLNMAKVTSVTDFGRERQVNLVGSTSRLPVRDTLAAFREALDSSCGIGLSTGRPS